METASLSPAETLRKKISAFIQSLAGDHIYYLSITIGCKHEHFLPELPIENFDLPVNIFHENEFIPLVSHSGQVHQPNPVQIEEHAEPFEHVIIRMIRL